MFPLNASKRYNRTSNTHIDPAYSWQATDSLFLSHFVIILFLAIRHGTGVLLLSLHATIFLQLIKFFVPNSKIYTGAFVLLLCFHLYTPNFKLFRLPMLGHGIDRSAWMALHLSMKQKYIPIAFAKLVTVNHYKIISFYRISDRRTRFQLLIARRRQSG